MGEMTFHACTRGLCTEACCCRWRNNQSIKECERRCNSKGDCSTMCTYNLYITYASVFTMSLLPIYFLCLLLMRKNTNIQWILFYELITTCNVVTFGSSNIINYCIIHQYQYQIKYMDMYTCKVVGLCVFFKLWKILAGVVKLDFCYIPYRLNKSWSFASIKIKSRSLWKLCTKNWSRRR